MMNVFMIKRGNEYLCNSDSGQFDENTEYALFFGSEGYAQSAIVEMSRKGFVSELPGAKIIRGSFEPIEGFDAMDFILKIGRWKKLYNVFIKDHTPAELMLITGCKDMYSASQLPMYKKICTLSKGFEGWAKFDGKDHSNGMYSRRIGPNSENENCFKMFKKLAFYAMNAKYKKNMEKGSE